MTSKRAKGKFSPDTACRVGDGVLSPVMEFRFKRIAGDTWFALYVGTHKAPLFSGMVSKDWPEQLRNAAKEADWQVADA